MSRIIINTTAWHYRWLKHLGLIGKSRERYVPGIGYQAYLSGPRSICPYFWLLALVTWMPLSVALFVVFEMATHPMTFAWSIVGLLMFAAGMTIVIGFLAGLYFSGKLLLYFSDKLFANENVKLPSLSFAGVAVEYVKAKKNGVCPLIEYSE